MRMRVPGNYTGWYGQTEFKDGVSVKLIAPNRANHLRAVMGGLEILQDDGVTIDEVLNVTPTILNLEYYRDANLTPPSVFVTNMQGEYCPGYGPDADKTATPVEETAVVVPVTEVAPVFTGEVTRENLEKIADESGISGLRDIGNQYGVKASSIAKLIDDILAASTADQKQ